MKRLSGSKKGDGGLSSTMVIMTAAVLGLLVLILVTGSFGKMFKTITGKEDCQIQFLVSSFTKTGGTQTVEPTCEPHLVTIDDKYLAANRGRAWRNIDTYSQNTKYQDSPSFKLFFDTYNHDNDQTKNLWVANEAMAKEMKYCWDITGRGKLDLFSDWWKTIDCYKDKDKKEPCVTQSDASIMDFDRWKTAVGNVASVAGNGVAGIFINGRGWSFEKPPTYCVLCARVKFSDEAKNSFTPTKDSFGIWLANTPVTDIGTYSKVSYSKYIQGDEFKGIWDPGYEYTNDKSYAIVYARVNVFKASQWMNTLGKFTKIIEDKDVPQSVQMIKLVPYQNLKDECTVLVG